MSVSSSYPRSIAERLEEKGLSNAIWTDDDWNGDRAVRADEGDFILYADGSIEESTGWDVWPPDPGEPLLAPDDEEAHRRRQEDARQRRAAQFVYELVNVETGCTPLGESGNIIDGPGFVFDFEFDGEMYNVEIAGPPYEQR